jgi:hypothetical protein
MLLNSLAEYERHDDAGRAVVITEWEQLKEELEAIANDYKFFQKTGYLRTEEQAEKETQNIAEVKLKIKALQDKISLKTARMLKATKASTKERNQIEIVQLRAEATQLKNKLTLMKS